MTSSLSQGGFSKSINIKIITELDLFRALFLQTFMLKS